MHPFTGFTVEQASLPCSKATVGRSSTAEDCAGYGGAERRDHGRVNLA